MPSGGLLALGRILLFMLKLVFKNVHGPLFVPEEEPRPILSSSEQFANPSALSRISNSFSPAVLEVRTHAKDKEGFDDLALGIDRHRCAASAASGILHGQVKRG